MAKYGYSHTQFDDPVLRKHARAALRGSKKAIEWLDKRGWALGQIRRYAEEEGWAPKQRNPHKVKGKSTTLKNMAFVTIRKLPNGVVKITGRKMAGKRNTGGPFSLSMADQQRLYRMWKREGWTNKETLGRQFGISAKSTATLIRTLNAAQRRGVKGLERR